MKGCAVHTPSTTAASASIASLRTLAASPNSASAAFPAASVSQMRPSWRRASSRSPGQLGSKSQSMALATTPSTCLARCGSKVACSVIGAIIYRPERSSVQRSAAVVELQLSLFDLGPDLAANLVPGGQVPLPDEGDRRSLLSG